MTHVLYKHVNGRDCAIFPVSVKRLRDGLEVTAYWVNVVNPKNKFIIDCVPQQTYKIPYDEVRNWVHIGDLHD